MQTNATPSDAPQINTTPLIDVMLVLLVMLIITLPIATHSVNLDLPSDHPPRQPERPIIDLDIDFDGRVFWNGTGASATQLEQWFRQAAHAHRRHRALLPCVEAGATRYRSCARAIQTPLRARVAAAVSREGGRAVIRAGGAGGVPPVFAGDVRVHAEMDS